MNDKIISVRNLCKSFSKTQVVKDVSFDVDRADFLSVMGPSGCGKSTLLYLIGGLEKATSGHVFLFGREMAEMTDKEASAFRRKNIGFVFQFFNLVPNLTVEENILVPVLMDGKNPDDYKTRLDMLLEFTSLEDKRNSYPSEMSGGQQQRTAVARALILNPPLLLADEPTGNLDSRNSVEIMKLFKRINEESGTAIVQVTHSMDIAESGKRIINLFDGQLINQQIL